MVSEGGGSGSSRVGNQELPFDRKPDLTAGDVKVRWAVWGIVKSRGLVDVTDYVKKRLKETGKIEYGDDLNSVAGDPSPGEGKWLILLLEFPDQSIRVSLYESKLFLSIPPDQISISGSFEKWSLDESRRANEMLGGQFEAVNQERSAIPVFRVSRFQ